MNKKSKTPFDPNSFDSITTIGNIIKDFEQLHSMDFSKVSLNSELSNLNYEIISSDYKDFEFKNIEDYYHYEVDKIV